MRRPHVTADNARAREWAQQAGARPRLTRNDDARGCSRGGVRLWLEASPSRFYSIFMFTATSVLSFSGVNETRRFSSLHSRLFLGPRITLESARQHILERCGHDSFAVPVCRTPSSFALPARAADLFLSHHLFPFLMHKISLRWIQNGLLLLTWW